MLIGFMLACKYQKTCATVPGHMRVARCPVSSPLPLPRVCGQAAFTAFVHAAATPQTSHASLFRMHSPDGPLMAQHDCEVSESPLSMLSASLPTIAEFPAISAASLPTPPQRISRSGGCIEIPYHLAASAIFIHIHIRALIGDCPDE